VVYGREGTWVLDGTCGPALEIPCYPESWSSDRSVAACRNGGIWRVPLDGSAPDQVAFLDYFDEEGPVNDRFALYDHFDNYVDWYMGTNSTLHLVDVTTGANRVPSIVSASTLTSGDELFFFHHEDNIFLDRPLNDSILIAGRPGSEPVAAAPVFVAPDNQWIAFVEPTCVDGALSECELFLRDAGGVVRSLGATDVSRRPWYSPDSQYLFYYDETDPAGYASLPLAGGAARKFDPPLSERTMAALGDGARITYGGGATEPVSIADVAGGRALFSTAEPYAITATSPDGRWVFLTEAFLSQTLTVLDTQTNAVTVLTSELTTSDVAITKDSSSAAYLVGANFLSSDLELRLVSLEPGLPVTPVVKGPVYVTFSFSEDGRWLEFGLNSNQLFFSDRAGNVTLAAHNFMGSQRIWFNGGFLAMIGKPPINQVSPYDLYLLYPPD
jgi:hypothetical protein